MAKGRWEPWLGFDGIALLQGWARDGLTDEQIAKNMGISRTTFYDWISRFPNIADTIKKGREVSDYIIENALFAKAANGDVASMIFYLTNRRPDKWQNKKQFSGQIDSNSTIVDGSIKIYIPDNGRSGTVE